ncbi:universal stress protein [Sphingomonas sp. RIT328]|uniref:universal stress protein n=1 Tax=Sphingomonas sp. RIT328 TaxID=1470591 RepID=UPI00044FA9B7|nr:universal stress protein [Sphingomonas sp. RIT328]EZP51271.1 Universal stress family protein [Sphingomonas sp. RIT328]
MQAATPILAQATATTILTVADGRAGLPAEDAATYSSRHGIAARIEPWQSSQGCTAQTLLAAIAARAPDLVVMGGFGHSRLKEALLGGVTRTMLDESPVPVLFAH